MPTPQDDVDALFGEPAPPAPVLPASTPPGRGAKDKRKEQRVNVSWPARVQLPGGKVVELRVRDLSEGGVGVLTPQHLPPDTVLNFAMGVPALDDPIRITPVSGTLRTTYVVVRGPELICGGTWAMLPEDGRQLLDEWIRRLRK